MNSPQSPDRLRPESTLSAALSARATWALSAVWVLAWSGLFIVLARWISAEPWPVVLALAAGACVPLALSAYALAGALRAVSVLSLAVRNGGTAGAQADLNNRGQFIALAEREWARCQRYGDDGAMLLVDTDHLRRINESLGQRGGDEVLVEVVARVGSTLRQSDVLARFDGAQLAVFLPHTDPLGALDAAERIRLQVASAPFRWEKAVVVATVSVGVAHVHSGQMALDGLIQECEAALAAAKEAGRNCVRAAPILPRQSDPSRSITPS